MSNILKLIVASSVMIGLAFALTNDADAQQSGADLAKKLSNPIASLISVPFQFNYDENIGPIDSGKKGFVNVQPVIPISLNEDWNIISRTILPIASQDEIFPGAGNQFGLGDVVQSLFFSPKAPTPGGLIWGVGPALLIPTATDELLGTEQFGLGPTAVALTQQGPWTIGALANHIWSVAGEDDRANINLTFLQPFLAFTTPDAWTFSANAESTYNWETDEWSVPVNLLATKLLKLGNQPISVGPGVRYWAKSATGGPQGWGARLQFTLLFPTGQ